MASSVDDDPIDASVSFSGDHQLNLPVYAPVWYVGLVGSLHRSDIHLLPTFDTVCIPSFSKPSPALRPSVKAISAEYSLCIIEVHTNSVCSIDEMQGILVFSYFGTRINLF